jgi:hypothetical protein
MTHLTPRHPTGRRGSGLRVRRLEDEDLGFEDRGSVELRGVPGTWQLLAVDRHGPPAGSAEAELASTPTPGPRSAMRRSDRAVEVMARRTPWILRGTARLTPATRRS